MLDNMIGCLRHDVFHVSVLSVYFYHAVYFSAKHGIAIRYCLSVCV